MAFKQGVSTVVASIDGKVVSQPKAITRFGNERIIEVTIESKRLSGVVDTFTVNFSSKLGVVLKNGDFIHIDGDIRTINSSKIPTFAVICIIYAKNISILDVEPDNYINDVILDNISLVDFKDVRKSYSNDKMDVADYKVSIHRGHNRFSYFKATSFGEDAIFMGNVHESIDMLSLKCRLCSSKSHSDSDKHFFYLAVYCLNPKFKEKEENNK